MQRNWQKMLTQNQNSPSLPTVWPRKRKVKFEHKNETLQDPEISFKTNFYFSVLDTTITSTNEKFEQLKMRNADFSFLYDMRVLSKKDDDVKWYDMIKWYKFLQKFTGKLIDSARGERGICAEDSIKELESILEPKMTPFKVLVYNFTRDLIGDFPECLYSFAHFIDTFGNGCCWRMIILETQTDKEPPAFID